MICTDILPPTWLFFSADGSRLMYYAYLSAMTLSLGAGVFVYIKNKATLVTNLFLLIAIFFSVWCVTEILQWVSVDSRIIMFTWSFNRILEILVVFTALYFSYVFLEKDDAPLWSKVLAGVLLAPAIILIPSHLNVPSLNLPECEAVSGPLVYYQYGLAAIGYSWLSITLLRAYRRASQYEKQKVAIFSFGILCFLTTYIGAEIIGHTTDYWNVSYYSLFGVLVFIGLVAYLVVQYHSFDVRILSAQMLVFFLIFLVVSQFFFVRNTASVMLTGATVVFVFIFGMSLVRAVRAGEESRRKLERLSNDLKMTNEHLRRLDKAKSEMLSIAAHQLRTPLTAMTGFLSLILEGDTGESVGPKNEETIVKVMRATNRLAQLVNNLLNMSRIDDGRMQYAMHSMRIEDLVRETTETFDVLAKERGLLLITDIPTNPLPLVMIDDGKMHEVISNLIHNAIKYTEKGRIMVRVWQSDATHVRVSVSDTGVGIPKDAIGTLFTKFTRADRNKMNTEGAGLGLYVCFNIVRDHKGRIWAESDGEATGSVFIVELPVAAQTPSV